MQFMMLAKSAENLGPPPKEFMDAIAKHSKAGKMVAGGGLAPTAMSTRVRLSRGQITTIDGPFTEAKEVIGGYAVVEFESKQAAIEATLRFLELHQKHWPGWEGETEIRQIFGFECLQKRFGLIDPPMRFMFLAKSAENLGPPPKELADAIEKLLQEAVQAGTMVESGGLAPTAMSARVRLSRGQITTIDGPFTEAKEVIGGYAVFELESKNAALEATMHSMELTKKHWPGWEGETEIRQIFGPEDFTCQPQKH